MKNRLFIYAFLICILLAVSSCKKENEINIPIGTFTCLIDSVAFIPTIVNAIEDPLYISIYGGRGSRLLSIGVPKDITSGKYIIPPYITGLNANYVNQNTFDGVAAENMTIEILEHNKNNKTLKAIFSFSGQLNFTGPVVQFTEGMMHVTY